MEDLDKFCADIMKYLQDLVSSVSKRYRLNRVHSSTMQILLSTFPSPDTYVLATSKMLPSCLPSSNCNQRP